MALDPLEHVLDHVLIEPLGITKHQILVVVAAVAVAIPCILLARRVQDGTPPRGRFWNFLEMLLMFIRDEVARPNISGGHDHAHGHDDQGQGLHTSVTSQTDPHAVSQHAKESASHRHPADRYVPFLWTLFLFILTCNLLGMVPIIGGSPTADISVTLVLASLVFLLIHGSAILKLGPGGYLGSFVPKLKGDNAVMNIFMTVLIVPMITVIEVLSALIRAVVLAIRLFANIFAGHVALAVIMMFALASNNGGFSAGGTVAAVLMGTALSMLELFVAFLQAFVFVLLSAIFLGLQLNPEH